MRNHAANSLADEVKVAKDAVGAAARIANRRFRSALELAQKDEGGDLVTDVDLACEAEMVRIIRDSFPRDSVVLEEAEAIYTDSRWTWIVDPLDGTNNYAFGLPLFGVALTLCLDGEPVLACLGEGQESALITGIKDRGIRVGDAVPDLPTFVPVRPSAALWVGYEVDRGGDQSIELMSLLARTMRRTFESWAPVVDVGLYLRGALDVIVGLRCSGTELPGALLVLREAGAKVVDLSGNEVSGKDVPEVFMAGRESAIEATLQAMKEGLSKPNPC